MINLDRAQSQYPCHTPLLAAITEAAIKANYNLIVFSLY